MTDGSKQARVLVVDDQEVNRIPLIVLLEQEGHAVLEAGSGERPSCSCGGGVDLVLLDVMMPGMDGFETCRRIRAEPDCLTLPVVFVTSLEDRESRVRGKEAGGDDFLNKPVDDVELLAQVRNLLAVKAYHNLQARQREALE